ncbi:MAG: UvrD-helicase domain-containing protein [Alistipes senegalensis]|nr:UvrD-helicase domain-containing protein [Oxalobacter formigenes]MCM1280605.1 UvrD-helicase domain-containing protein [Alistipes senegalensis]
MQKLLDLLNPEQLAAVTLPSEPALILAGAGSGKTRVLTTRIAWLLKTGLVSPSGILAVTFTNKAAREMTARLSGMTPVSTRGMWIGTFHGLCNRFLRAHYRDANLPQAFQIMDTQDQLSFVRRLLKNAQADENRYPPRSLVYYINQAKEKGLRAVRMEEEAAGDYDRMMAQLYAQYEAQCQREGVVDFAELLLRSYELLSRNALLREHYQARFAHILVDEFQDTNDLQYAWLKLMAGGGAAVFAVGDDDQSIYAFRGANVGNMTAFRDDFHVRHLIRLEENYRSHGYILEAANTLIAHNSHRLGKNLRTRAGEGEPVRVFGAVSDFDEAQYVVEEAASLVAEGWLRQEIAVLYRSNAQSRVIEHALFSAGIPYRVYGGLRFFERAEIKHAVAYLQLMENPRNDSAFLRIVNFPARGIGARSLEHLQEAAQAHGVSLYDAVPFLSGKAGNALGTFVRLIDSVCNEVKQMPLPQMVQTVIERSGLPAHYGKEKEGADRIENLGQLASAAELFLGEEGLPLDMPALFASQAWSEAADGEQAVEMTPLAAFLAHASLEAGDNQAEDGQDALQLMTVHAAKGLEFDAVFITGLEEGLFPHDNSAREADGLEEERRLMYVAITRARKRLYLSYAQTRMLHGQSRYNPSSRFLDELPEAVLKWVTPKKQGYGTGGAWKAKEASWMRPAEKAAAAGFAAGNASAWRIGEAVFHPKFGEGVIIGLEGSGTHMRANVRFKEAGTKLLDLGIAKLQRLA